MNSGRSYSAGHFSHSPLGPLATVMAQAAEHAADNLQASREIGLQYGEVTITETSLLMLVKAIKELHVSSKVDGKPESKTGADFEFWIQGHQKWFSFVVQAKKMKLEGATTTREGITTYDVGYEVGDRKTPQIDLLLKNRKPALYALYNTPGMGPSRGFGDQLHNTSYVNRSCEPTLTRFMDGITIVPGEAMKLAFDETQSGASWWNQMLKNAPKKPLQHLKVGKSKAATLFTTQRAFPWSCLATCPVTSICKERTSWLDLIDDEFMRFFRSESDFSTDPAYLMAKSIVDLHLLAHEDYFPFIPIDDLLDAVDSGFVTEAPDYVLNRSENGERVSVEEGAGSTADYIVTLFLDPEAENRSPDGEPLR